MKLAPAVTKFVQHSLSVTRRGPSGPSPRRASVQRRTMPSPQEIVIEIVVLALFAAALVYILERTQRFTPPVNPEARLELSLSGALTSDLSLSAEALSAVTWSPSGFSLRTSGNTVTPLTLSLTGLRGERGSYQLLGSDSALTLTVAGTRYTLLSGTVSSSPEVRTFNATLVNAQSQPLQISGRFTHP